MGVLTDINGSRVLDDVRHFVSRFCAFPDEHCLIAVTLWAAHAHIVEHVHTTPRLALLSPEPASGKTRVLEVLHLLVPEPLFNISASPAAIFRTLVSKQITLLFDEVDTIWSSKGRNDHNEDLRGLLNSGYKLGAEIPRCVGPKHEVVSFPVFCAAALAGLGDLPDTVMSRSIIVRMRRRGPGEFVEPFRTRQHEPQGHALRDRLALWAESVGVEIGEAWPELPPGIVDRPAEVWEPLIAVADAAGGVWPEAARAACVELCKVAEDRRVSLGVRLLADLRIIFGDRNAMHTETIIERLVAADDLDPDAPWAELRGKPIGVRGLASMLKPYGVHSRKVKVDGRCLQGYRREDLWDAWTRYLSPVSAEVEPPEPPGPTKVSAAPQVPQVPATRAPERESVPKVPQVPETRNTGPEVIL